MTKSYGVGYGAQIPKIQEWIRTRRLAGQGDFPFLRVAPEDNVILGADRICAYLGIRSRITMVRWIELYGLPAVKRPDNIYITTMTAIDQWLFLASEVENENRPWSRGTNARLSLARRRLDDKLREAERKRALLEPRSGEGEAHGSRTVDGRPIESEAEKI